MYNQDYILNVLWDWMHCDNKFTFILLCIKKIPRILDEDDENDGEKNINNKSNNLPIEMAKQINFQNNIITEEEKGMK